jgi:hypothetical protein
MHALQGLSNRQNSIGDMKPVHEWCVKTSMISLPSW